MGDSTNSTPDIISPHVVAANIASGTNGFDRDYSPSATQFNQIYSDGYRFYIGYTQHMTDTDLSNALTNGFAVMMVEGFYSGMVSDYTGAEWAQYAINAAQTIGYLTGCNLWLDLEGISNSANEVIPWANDWYDAVQSAGYVPGIYVGEPEPLTSSQLYYDLNFSHYWRSCSGSTPNVDVRGYQMFQTQCNAVIAGISVDLDTVQTDNQGGLPIAEYYVP